MFLRSFHIASKRWKALKCLECSSMCFKPHTESKNIIFWSQIPDSRGGEKRVSFVLCLPVQRELHWGILFSLSFSEIMIWHAGQFLTWLPHKNPLSIPLPNLHCKKGHRGAAQLFEKLTINKEWWHGKVNNTEEELHVKYFDQARKQTHRCVHVCVCHQHHVPSFMQQLDYLCGIQTWWYTQIRTFSVRKIDLTA